jgi:SAM-dependent methyltransferase
MRDVGFSFEAVDALDYEDLRPGYAPEAVRWVVERAGVDPGSVVVERAGVDPGSVVVDLAAGTGHLSGRFDELGIPVVAIEPAGNLRRVLKQRLPSVRTVAGVAERMPLGDASGELVVVGNAFHHFDEAKAFPELRRILGPGGVLALFWARTDGERDPALAAVERVVLDTVERSGSPSAFVDAYYAWRDPPWRVGGFAVVERRSFPHPHVVASARLADLYATSSDVASLPGPERAALLARVRQLTQDLPETLEIDGTSDVDLLVRDGTGSS